MTMNVSRVIRLKDDEKVLRVVRNHWVTHVGGALLGSALFAAPFFFMVPLFALGVPGLLIFAACALLGALIAARTVVVWYWNAFVITSLRVVDIDQRGFFSRTVSEATYDKVQDVSYSVKGVLGTLLRYGALELQTAGAVSNLELPRVHEPKEVHHLITEAVAAHRTHANGGARSEKVAHLLDAASDLNDSEARAFLVALQGALKQEGRDLPSDEDLEWLKRDIKDGQ